MIKSILFSPCYVKIYFIYNILFLHGLNATSIILMCFYLVAMICFLAVTGLQPSVFRLRHAWGCSFATAISNRLETIAI